MRKRYLLKRVVIRTKAETRIPMIKSTGGQKNASNVTSKVTQRLIVQNAIRKTAIKIKVMTISPDLVNPENQASLTLAS